MERLRGVEIDDDDAVLLDESLELFNCGNIFLSHWELNNACIAQQSQDLMEIVTEYPIRRRTFLDECEYAI